MAAAIDRARLKIARNEELGFDFTPIEEKAGRAYNEMKGGTITPSKAEIGHAVGRPRIDGRLDDEAWKTASKLGPFQNFRMASEALHTRTIAYMAYDETNLYVGFRCDEPQKQKLAAKHAQDSYQAKLEGLGKIKQAKIDSITKLLPARSCFELDQMLFDLQNEGQVQEEELNYPSDESN